MMLFPKASSGLEVAVGAVVIALVLFALAIAPVGMKRPEGYPFAVELSTGEFLVCDRFWDDQAICRIRGFKPEEVRLIE